MPEEFLTIDRFEDHLKETDYRDKIVSVDLKDIRTSLDNKVSYQNYQWTLGLSMSAILVILGWIVSLNYQVQAKFDAQSKETITRFENQAKDMSIVASDISQVKGKLEPFNIEFKK